MHFDEDVVVIHDPQPAPLVCAREGGRKNHWIWRCHIDLSNPNPEVWGFLRPYVERFDAAIFSSQSFARQLPIPQYLFYPCIDPLSEKNKELDEVFVQKVCDDFNIDRKRPIVTQVSRFDRLKDPVGVIQAYKLAKQYVDCQLVLAGGGASDDPEGAAVFKKLKKQPATIRTSSFWICRRGARWRSTPCSARPRLSCRSRLKKASGLTVTEALWKGKPTIAGAVGGIPNQIIHKLTGVLVHSVEGCAYQIRYLLTHPEFAQQLGTAGKDHVKENFLITTNIRRWLLLFRILRGIS